MRIEACSSLERSLINCVVLDVFISLYHANIVTLRGDSISLNTHISEYFPCVSKLTIGLFHQYGLSVIHTNEYCRTKKTLLNIL